MTRIKLCGLRRACDIAYVNELMPEYVGFVFARSSKRYVTPEEAAVLRKQLNRGIIPVGVFVDEKIDVIAALLEQGIIGAVQLHGNEDEDYINALREQVKCKLIKAFRIGSREDITAAKHSTADYILLDSGGGSGEVFDWRMIEGLGRPYFLAGGLTSENVQRAIAELQPFGVDASSALETEGFKDKEKMAAFVKAVR